MPSERPIIPESEVRRMMQAGIPIIGQGQQTPPNPGQPMPAPPLEESPYKCLNCGARPPMMPAGHPMAGEPISYMVRTPGPNPGDPMVTTRHCLICKMEKDRELYPELVPVSATPETDNIYQVPVGNNITGLNFNPDDRS